MIVEWNQNLCIQMKILLFQINRVQSRVKLKSGRWEIGNGRLDIVEIQTQIEQLFGIFRIKNFKLLSENFCIVGHVERQEKRTRRWPNKLSEQSCYSCTCLKQWKITSKKSPTLTLSYPYSLFVVEMTSWVIC